MPKQKRHPPLPIGPVLFTPLCGLSSTKKCARGGCAADRPGAKGTAPVRALGAWSAQISSFGHGGQKDPAKSDYLVDLDVIRCVGPAETSRFVQKSTFS